MRPELGVLLLCLFFVSGAQAWATVLPDSCGDDKVKFDVTTQKSKLASPPPDPNKASLIFVQRVGSCIGCSMTRVGLDGAWVGVDKGNSYFAVTVPPGVHHVCASWEAPLATMENKIGLTEVLAEAGQKYYFEIEVGPPSHDNAPVMRLKSVSGDMGAFLTSRSKESIAKPISH